MRILRLLLANAMVFVGCLLSIELAGQAYAYFRPAYEVFAWEPDPIIGWKLVPNFQWTWAGAYWYARDFSVPVSTNSHGFRDLPREFQKPEGTVRIALLGDSFVEAMQVPFHQTAGHLLEQKLNAAAGRNAAHPIRYEVLNFGVSSHSLGQSLLTWEAYASRFSPDYVFVFVAKRPLERTVTPYEYGAFPRTKQRKLNVRPTFQLETDRLVREPARDFDSFLKVQQEVIEAEFGGSGRIKWKHGFFIKPYVQELTNLARLCFRQLFPRKKLENRDKLTPQGFEESVFEVNLKVLETLGEEVKQKGAQWVIVDAMNYTSPNPMAESILLKRFSAERQWGYLPLSDYLLDGERNGVLTHWRHDGHFNQAGNQIFAEAMYHWMIDHSLSR